MSIIRMSNLAAERETNLVTSVTPSAAPTSPEVQSALDKIAAYIPSEVIGTYVAISGILLPTSANPKWIIFGIALLLIPLLTLVGNAIAKKRGLTAPSGRATVWIIVLACVAFCAWALALPDNPLVDYYDDASRIGGVAVIVLAVLLPQVAELLGISPR